MFTHLLSFAHVNFHKAMCFCYMKNKAISSPWCLPSVQRSPTNEVSVQSQVNEFHSCLQRPPFLHASGEHSESGPGEECKARKSQHYDICNKVFMSNNRATNDML